MLYLPFIAVLAAVILWFIGPFILASLYWAGCAALIIASIWLCGVFLLYVVPVLFGWLFLIINKAIFFAKEEKEEGKDNG